MADTFHDNVKVTTLSAPNLGSFVWNAAVTDATNGDYLTPDAAGAAATGETHSLVFHDGHNVSLEEGCAYTASTKTWARGTVVWSTTGGQLTLSASATASIVASSREITNASAVDAIYFGDGSDGDVTISGSVTLVRDMHYRNLTLTTGAQLTPVACAIYVSGILDISAAPAGAVISNSSAGTAASGSTGGGSTAPSSGTFRSLPNWGSTSQPNGASGATGAGSNGAGGSAAGNVYLTPEVSVTCGAGGAGVSAGGAAATFTPTYVSTWGSALLHLSPYARDLYASSFPGNGGAAGGGDGTNKGGGGGGGPRGANGILIFARTINRGASTAAAAIQAIGGAGGGGGTPSTGNCGGGGGGGGATGGFVTLGYRYLTGATAANCVDVSGGAGGVGGNGVGTGVGGDGGQSGASGIFVTIDVGAGTVIQQMSATQNAGSAHTGITGGSGGAQVVTRYSL